MSRLRALGATLVWLVVVASVSALVWVAISRAGDGLVSSGQPLMATEAAPLRTPSARSSGTPSATPSTPTAQPSTPVTEERRTWQGQVGSVVAACDSTGIRFVSAQPANGFRAEVKDEDEMIEIEIEFEGREDQSGTDVSVRARCVGGIPSFSASKDD